MNSIKYSNRWGLTNDSSRQQWFWPSQSVSFCNIQYICSSTFLPGKNAVVMTATQSGLHSRIMTITVLLFALFLSLSHTHSFSMVLCWAWSPQGRKQDLPYQHKLILGLNRFSHILILQTSQLSRSF